jgi:threonine dehydrogenase-like Zn-dependent dehydrogenase
VNPAELKQAVIELKSPLILDSSEISEMEYRFKLIGKKCEWNISLKFPSLFPYCLPSPKLLDIDKIGIIPHVNQSGIICVEESDSIILDGGRASDIIDHFISDTISLLDRAALKISQDELFDELEGYFSFPGKVNSFYVAKDTTEFVTLRVKKTGSGTKLENCPILLCGRDNRLPNDFSNLSNPPGTSDHKIIHLALDRPMLPPANKGDITPSYLKAMKYNLSDRNKAVLSQLLKTPKIRKSFFVLISMFRTQKERSQFLLCFSSKKSLLHPLSDMHDDWSIKPYTITRHSEQYLLERGGAETSLATKKVSIIGCGSVGSEISAMLAKSGIGELVLVDHDSFDADNIYRHRLGGSSLNFQVNSKIGKVANYTKVSALALSLRSDIPYIKIKQKPVGFDSVTSDSDFLTSDVVIVAVGSPSTNLYINKVLKSLDKTAAIFCWNEASGYGGHSVALDLDIACFECSYTDEHGFNMCNGLSLVASGQIISKNLTGCAGVFTPFSYLDSSQTAAIATKQCIDMLLGEYSSKAISWKGDDKHELRVTERFNAMPLKEEVDLLHAENCRVCHEQ